MSLSTSEPFALNEEEPRIYELLEATFGMGGFLPFGMRGNRFRQR